MGRNLRDPGDKKLHHPGDEVECVNVPSERPLDPRSQHLDGHVLAGLGNPRPVHLRDRGGGNGFGKL